MAHKTEFMDVTFGVASLGDPIKHAIEIETNGKRLSILADDRDTLFLHLRKEMSEKETGIFAEYLRQNIESISLLTSR